MLYLLHRQVWNSLITLFILLLVSCGGGGGSSEVDSDDGGGSGGSTATSINLVLKSGDFWEFLGIAEATSFAQPDTNNADVSVGRFRVTLGTAVQIDGITAYPLNITGNPGDFLPRWTHIAVNSEGSLLGSIDGANLETVYNALTDQWVGGGFFVNFSADEQVSLTNGVFPGNYNSVNALIAGHEQNSGGCEQILGIIFCDDQSTTFSEREFYLEGIGPVGYALDATFSSGSGGFFTAFTRNTRIELIGTSFTAADTSIVFNLPPWEEMAPLNNARAGHSAVVADGKIYVIGGSDENGTLLSSVEVYDPQSNTWSSGVPLPEAPVSGVNAAVINDLIYVPVDINTVRVFDPATSLWTVNNPTNSPGLGMQDTAIYNDTTFGFGEIVVSAIGSPNIEFSGYSPGTNEWLSATGMIFFVERLRSTIEVVADSMFILGGFGRIGTLLDERGARNDITEYDIVNDVWITSADLSGRMNVARDSLATTVFNNQIYIFGGVPVSCSAFDPNNCSTGIPLRDVEIYDPSTRNSSDLAPMFQPRLRFDAVALGGRIYVIGGSDGDNALAKVERYTP